MSHQIDNDAHKLTTMTWESKVTIKSETTTGTTPRGMLEQEYFEMKYAKFHFIIIILLNWYLLFYSITNSTGGG